MRALLSAVALAAAAAGEREFRFARRARQADARFARGRDGIIRGAGPFTCGPPAAATAVLLLHGFGDTPQSVRAVGEALGRAGYAVCAPLLAGHGRTVRAFARSRAAQWQADAAAAYARLADAHARVAIVGQSMGGALSVMLAATLGAGLPALVLLAPYLDASPTVRRIARWWRLTSLAAPVLGSAGGEGSLRDPAARAASLGYGVTTPRLLAELTALADEARTALPAVTAPTLLVQSRLDNRIAPAVAERAMARLGSETRALVWLQHSGHVIAADGEHARVSSLAKEWLAAHAPACGA